VSASKRRPAIVLAALTIIEGDVFRMIISVPEFGEQSSPGGPRSGPSQAQVRPKSGPSQARVRPESIRIQLLMALDSAPLKKSELAAILGHKSISRTLKAHMREMLAEDLIEFVIPDKPKSRLQKYRLTEKGRQWVSCRDTDIENEGLAKC